MKLVIPYETPGAWESSRAKWLFESQQRPVGRDSEVVTAFRNGEVTARSRRRTEGFTNAVEEIGYQGVRKGDLVIHSMDGFAGAIGVSDSDGKMSPVVHCYRPRPSVDARYYAYLLRDLAVRGYVTSLARGIRERSTAFDCQTFRSLVLPVPPEACQRAIADYLDTETARIDALIEKKQRMESLLEERWRAAAFERVQRVAAQYGCVPLRRVVRCLDGRRVPLSSEQRASRGGPYPYYGASNVLDYVDDFLFDEDLVLVGEDGAQLGDPTYAIAQRVAGKIWVNNHAHVLRPISVDADLLVFLLNTFNRVPFMSGATREKITQEDLGRVPFPNAPSHVQAVEASRLVAIRSGCDAVVTALRTQMEKLREHRQALITAAVTGELHIPGVAA